MRAIVLSLVLAGCARTVDAYKITTAPVPATTSAAPEAAAARATARAAADALWEQRGDKAKLQEALAAYGALQAQDPADREVAVRLVRGWYFLGDGHETDKAARQAAWSTAIDHGRRCLAMNTDFTGLLAKGDETEESAARAFTKDDVACLYWTSSALGKWAKAEGLVTTLQHIGTVKAWMRRVGELDPTYYYGGPDRYFAAVYAASPSFAGQDLGKSKELFDKVIAAYPSFLGHYVLKSEMWATKSQQREAFRTGLEWVLAQPVDALADVKPEMEAEQRKARALLATEGDYFAN
jgi:hypothetical protein